MLRLSKLLLTGAGAAALLMSASALAQAGLGQRLDAQEQQLAQAENSCGPVNLAEYANLLHEAMQNKQRADKMAKKGVPVNQAQVDADLAKATQLFARAQAAQARNCMLQAQQQATPNPPAAQTTGQPSPTPAGTASAVGLDDKLAQAKSQLDADIKACKPVSSENYKRMYEEAQANLRNAKKAMKAGAPVDLDKLQNDYSRAMDLYYRAKEAETKQSEKCPPKREAQTETPPKTTGAVPSQPLNSYEQTALDAHNAVRARLGSPPMRWDPQLEQYAIGRSQELARSGQLVHASREGRENIRENILKAPASYSIANQMKLWTDEFNDFVPGTFPQVCRSGGDCGGVLHLTQMAWPTTLYVGCGSTVSGGFVYTVCGYPKGANQDGKEIGTQAASANGYQKAAETWRAGSINVTVLPVNFAPQAPQATTGPDSTFTNFGFDLSSGDEPQFGWGADVDLVNKYIWRGFNLSGDPDVSIWSFYGEVGGRFDLGSSWLTPFAAVDYSDVKLPSFTESGIPGSIYSVDLTVEQPSLPAKEAFNSSPPEMKPGKPSYASPTYLDWCKNVVFDDQARLFESARKARDPAGMQAAQAQMEVAIGQQRRYLSDITEAGEMADADPRQVQQDLDRMVDLYKGYTGNDPPGGPPSDAQSCPTKVSQPQLPSGEVFTPQQPQPTSIDPM
jgi:chemotaxis protein histidine kinase CheA